MQGIVSQVRTMVSADLVRSLALFTAFSHRASSYWAVLLQRLFSGGKIEEPFSNTPVNRAKRVGFMRDFDLQSW